MNRYLRSRVPVLIKQEPSEDSSSPVGISLELEEVHFNDRILIQDDGQVVHCNGEKLTPELEPEQGSSSPTPNYQSDTEDDFYSEDDSDQSHDLSDKKNRKRHQNVQAARRYRAKVQKELKCLQKQISILETTNHDLLREEMSTRKELLLVRRILRDKLLTRKCQRVQIKTELPDEPPPELELMELEEEEFGEECQSSFPPCPVSSSSGPRRGRPPKLRKAPLSNDQDQDDQDLEPRLRKVRKRIQNRKAAANYRKRLQIQNNLTSKEIKRQQEINQDLKRQIDELQTELKVTRALVRTKFVKSTFYLKKVVKVVNDKLNDKKHSRSRKQQLVKHDLLLD